MKLSLNLLPYNQSYKFYLMTYFFRFFLAILGALMNHIRGGLLAVLKIKRVAARDKISFEEASAKVGRTLNGIGKQANHILFALVFTFSLNIHEWYMFLLSTVVLYVGMFGGASIGWGAYINGMINRNFTPRKEVAIIDSLVIKGKTSNPVFWNTLALSLRGMIWTTCVALSFLLLSCMDIGIPSLIFGIIPVGLLMGPAYLLAMEVCQRITTRGNGWQIGEYLWGFVLWGAIAILIK